MLSGIISLDHNEKEPAHEPQSEKLNNGNPSSSSGPCEFQKLIIAGWIKGLLKAWYKVLRNVVMEFQSVNNTLSKKQKELLQLVWHRSIK